MKQNYYEIGELVYFNGKLARIEGYNYRWRGLPTAISYRRPVKDELHQIYVFSHYDTSVKRIPMGHGFLTRYSERRAKTYNKKRGFDSTY